MRKTWRKVERRIVRRERKREKGSRERRVFVEGEIGVRKEKDKGEEEREKWK